MHVPDGYLGPVTAAATFAVMLPAWAVAARRVERAAGTRDVPRVALAAAAAFVVMLFNVPLPGGTTGHAVGGALAAVVLGPAAAVLALSVTLAVQALVFGDGGVLALGANCLSMGLVMAVSGYAVFRALAGPAPGPRRAALAAGIAGYAAACLSALTTAVLLGLQPALEPGHFPYGPGVTVPAMLLPHLLLVGVVEGVVTGGVVAYLASLAPGGEAALRPPATHGRLWAALGGLCLLSPLGLLAPGAPWGEWGPDELAARLGHVPEGVARWEGRWQAPLADYAVAALGETPLGLAVGYVVSAVVGATIVVASVAALGRALGRATDGHGARAPEDGGGGGGGGGGSAARPAGSAGRPEATEDTEDGGGSGGGGAGPVAGGSAP